jgi:sugar O-acyltransferase (sialic acid O-acetyltransferase NeuD family)
VKLSLLKFKKKKLLIFGAAEIAELAAYYFSLDSEYQVVAFVVDDEFVNANSNKNLPIISWSEALLNFPPNDYFMHIALSYKNLNKLREEKFIQCELAGYELVNYISSKATTFPDLKVGKNCFILENQNIQPRVTIGNNVMLWSGNHIGHGSEINDHTYIASHVVISGHVKIGKRCFVGVNATVRDFIQISDDCLVGMSSIVTKNLAVGTVVLPPRSEIIDGSDERAGKIIQKNFGE